MKFSESFKEKVVQASNLLQLIEEKGIALKRAGSSNYQGLCPFHAEKSPSFSVNAQKGFFHCFGCGVSGDCIKFVMLYDRLSFPEALKELAQRAGIPLEQETIQEKKRELEDDRGLSALKTAMQLYHQLLFQDASAKQANEYLQQRSVSQAMQDRFYLGYAPEKWQTLVDHLHKAAFTVAEIEKTGLVKFSEKNGKPYDLFRQRIMFPIRDLRGRPVAFGARSIDPNQQPKYLNSPETPYYHKSQILFGFYEGLKTIQKSRQIYIVEGYLDVIRMHEHGLVEAVAPCGTSLTPEHVKLLCRYVDRVTLIFDGDRAGQAAALRNGKLFLPYPLDVQVATLTQGEDPDSFLLKSGKEKFIELLQKGNSLLEFLVQQTLAKYSTNVQGRNRALEELLPSLNLIPKEEIRALTLVQLADIVRIPLETLQNLANSLRFQGKKATIETFNETSVPFSIQEVDPHEKRILQIMLQERSLFNFCKEQLKAEEFEQEALQTCYLELSQVESSTIATWRFEEIEQHCDSGKELLAQLQMENLNQENLEHQLRKAIRMLKDRNLKREQEEFLQSQPSHEEILAMSVAFRKRRAELDTIYKLR